MLYEIRFYRATPGRLNDLHARFRDRLPPLMQRLGIRIVGNWSVLAGPQVPLFVYIVAFEDAADRESRWNAFYVDPEWLEIRRETNAGSELVERYDVMLVKPNPQWSPPLGDTDSRLGGIHELVLLDTGLGRGAEAQAAFYDNWLPAVQRAGAVPMMVADVTVGTGLPRMAVLLCWHDAESWHQGTVALEADTGLCAALANERELQGSASLQRADTYLLQPPSYSLPLSTLGYAKP